MFKKYNFPILLIFKIVYFNYLLIILGKTILRNIRSILLFVNKSLINAYFLKNKISLKDVFKISSARILFTLII